MAVFTLMKPGAAVLFIDNAGGGFYELVSKAANRSGLTNFSVPFRHLKYQSDMFKRKMFGYFSLSSTTVAVQMWQKAYPVPLNRWTSHLNTPRSFDSQFRASNYGSRSSGDSNFIDSQKVKQCVNERKCENSILGSTNTISKKSKEYAFKAEASASQNIYNSLTKMTGSTGHCSGSHVAQVLPAARSSMQPLRTSIMSGSNVQVYPKQQNTNGIPGHSLCAEKPQAQNPTLLSVSEQKKMLIRSGIKEHDARGYSLDAENAESNLYTSSLQGAKVQTAPSSSLESEPERNFRNRRYKESTCCCFIL